MRAFWSTGGYPADDLGHAIPPWEVYTLVDAEVLRRGPYRFFFFSGDRMEPPHVHVERDDSLAKFWLNPVRLQASGGFSRLEIKRLGALVVKNETHLLREWYAFFGS